MPRSRPALLLILGLLTVCFASASGQVSGLISDPELKPLVKAQVEFITPDANSLHPKRYDVSATGSFRLDPGPVRIFSLNFTAAFCEPLSVMVYRPKLEPVKLDVRLRPYAWVRDYKDVRIIGDFNSFSRNSGAVALHALSDGSYFADINNSLSGKMSYRLTGLVVDSPLSVPGTHYDEITVDADGRYASVLRVKPGRVRILFDPGRLPRAAGKAQALFEHPDSTMAKVAAAYGAMYRRMQDYSLASSAFRAAGHDSRDFRYDWSGEAAQLRQQLDREKDDAVRQALWIALLDLGRLGCQDVNSLTAQKALAAIPPESELWQLAGQSLLFDSIQLAGRLGRYGNYFKKVITRNPSRLVRAYALERAYFVARADKKPAESKEYFRTLTRDYGDLLPGQRVKAMPPETKFAPGLPMPAFRFVSFDNPKVTLTNATFKGKSYLLDFWATWCGPCLAEMDRLHKVYAQYGPKGFEILSVSFDKTAEDVRRYRLGQWAMPWRHAFLGMSEFAVGSKTSEYFELTEIPNGILVDASGKIIAVGEDARGENLSRNLARLFGR